MSECMEQADNTAISEHDPKSDGTGDGEAHDESNQQTPQFRPTFPSFSGTATDLVPNATLDFTGENPGTRCASHSIRVDACHC